MDSFLARGPETVSFRHDRNLLQHDPNIAVGQKQQGRENPRHMEPAQSGTEGVDGGGRNEQKGGHQREKALEHQRYHGNYTAGHGNGSQLQQGSVVQKGIGKAHGADQGQHDAQLVKAEAYRDSGHLKHNDGIEHHHYQPGKIVFGKGDDHTDVEDRGKKLAQWVQGVNGRVLCRQSIHFPKLGLGMKEFVHWGAPCGCGFRDSTASADFFTVQLHCTSAEPVLEPPGGDIFAEIQNEESGNWD